MGSVGTRTIKTKHGERNEGEIASVHLVSLKLRGKLLVSRSGL